MGYPLSEAWWKRAEKVVPLGTQTLSKGPTQYVQGVTPIFLQRGSGSHVWDVDGNRFVDFPMALGPVIIGYCEKAVDEAVRAQLDEGITFTLMHPLEVEVAERIVAMCPGVEAVRFGKSGSDALSAAIRAARAHTGRDMVLVAGYHGWHDWYIGSTTRDTGVPTGVKRLTKVFRYGDLRALEKALRDNLDCVAAVVLEPSGLEVPEDGYLQGVVDMARHHGALSIFDEVITGFRLAPGGARERYSVRPDLSCYGKALGNGMPISAVAGSWSVMREFESIFFSGTHGGEALSLAAAKAVLDLLADGRVLGEIERKGVGLQARIRDLVKRHGVSSQIQVGGEPQRTLVVPVDDRGQVVRSWLQQCLAEAGALFNGSLFICARHDGADFDIAVEGFDKAFSALGSGGDIEAMLAGPPVQPVFRPVL